MFSRPCGGSPDSNLISGVSPVANNETYCSAGQSMSRSVFLGTANAMGNNSVVDVFSGVTAIGGGALVNGNGVVTDVTIVGAGARAGTGRTGTVGVPVIGMTAFGANATVAENNGTAVGSSAQSDGLGATVVGMGAIARGESSVRLGYFGRAEGLGATSLGAYATATGTDALAVGRLSVANSDGAVAMGGQARVQAPNAVAIGSGASVSGGNSLAIGAGNTVSGTGSGAIGDPSTVTGDGSYTLGNDNIVDAADAGVFGNNNTLSAAAAGSRVLGNGNSLGVADAFVLGNAANVTVGGGVAIGSGSVASTGAGTMAYVPAQASAGATTAINATQSTLSAVSVGDAATGKYRQITGVAAGTADSDAANVAQLRAVNDTATAGWNVSAQGANTSNVAPGGTVDFSSSDANLGVRKTAGSNNVSFTLAQDLTLNSVTLGGTTLQASGLFIGGGPSVSTAGIDGGGLQVKNIAAGSADADAVNVAQLRAVSDTATAGWNLSAQGANASNVAPGGTVDFSSSDANLVVSKAAGSNNVSLTLAQDLTLNSVALGGTTLQANGLFIGGGPSISTGGINASGTRIINLLAGVNPGDAVNMSQLTAVQASTVHYYSVNDGGAQGANYANDGATASGALAAGVGTSASAAGATAVGSNSTASAAGATAVGSGAEASAAGSVALGANASDGGRGAETYVGKYSGVANDSVGTVSVGNAATGDTRTISNVADAREATDAVNLRQLDGAVQESKNYTDTKFASVGDLQNGTDGFFQVENTDGKAKPAATGANAAAGGAGAVAAAAKSLAVGTDASATADNAVALGANSVADRANSVSVGSAANKRQITNVAAGTEDTDAVNVGQLKESQAGGVRYDTHADGSNDYSRITLGNNAGTTTIANVSPGVAGTDAVNVNQLNAGIASANQYTDQRVSQVERRMDSLRHDSNAAAAGAIAMANLPQAFLPGRSMASVGMGSYEGQAALAIGVSRLMENGKWVMKLGSSANTRGKFGVGAGIGFMW
ncbi:YadA family autotransporter adhesin [Bordetella bronchiseptica]|uniref:YadA family autotransporter adhesin n=1 Tax=Bordetella bronchiseptica TaxID=518 RepID=UPI001363BB55|nr:YadA-like family protein [Bordetella bronchiseptica]